MTQTSTRPLARFGAVVLSALVAVTLWLPTVIVPVDQAEFAVADATVELA